MMNNDWIYEMERTLKNNLYECLMKTVEDIIVNDNKVVIKFTDGNVYHAEAHNGDEFSRESGLVWCWLKYLLGDSGIANKLVKASEVFIEEKEKAREAERQRIRLEAKMTKGAKRYLKSINSAVDNLEDKLKEEEIELRKEAFLRAIWEWNTETAKVDNSISEATEEV